MIWNDVKISQWAAAGGVTPFEPACVNPASIDLRLGNKIREPHKIWTCRSEIDMRKDIESGVIEHLPRWGEPTEFDVFWLMPRRFVLCHSLELVRIPKDCVSLLFSKSSTGRIGLEHLHAGLGDSSWFGQWTFELHNVSPWPIKLEAGKRYMQMTIMQMTGEALRGYDVTGRYNGQSGPTPAIPDAQDQLLSIATP